MFGSLRLIVLTSQGCCWEQSKSETCYRTPGPSWDLECSCIIIMISGTWPNPLHYFPIAAGTNCLESNGLKQQEFIFLWLWKSEVCNGSSSTKIKMSAELVPSGSSREVSVPCFLQLLVAAGGPWIEDAPLWSLLQSPRWLLFCSQTSLLPLS